MKVVFIASDKLGTGDPDVSDILLRKFLNTLVEVEPLPDAMIFINSGVYLVCDSSPNLSDLKILSEAGVDILSCGTCIDMYDLAERVEVGRISNMKEIAEKLLSADSVVRP